MTGNTDRIIVTVADDGTNVTITAGGWLDLTNAREFRDALARASASERDVTVDLRGAEFIDTAILEYLARAAQAMLETGRRLKTIVRDGGHPQRVLRTVGFAAVMDIVAEPAPA